MATQEFKDGVTEVTIDIGTLYITYDPEHPWMLRVRVVFKEPDQDDLVFTHQTEPGETFRQIGCDIRHTIQVFMTNSAKLQLLAHKVAGNPLQ